MTIRFAKRHQAQNEKRAEKHEQRSAAIIAAADADMTPRQEKRVARRALRETTRALRASYRAEYYEAVADRKTAAAADSALL